MEFENACSEIYYIIEHMNSSDVKKIPESTIRFFRDNRSLFYKVNLDVSKNLCDQNLKDETKAFIQILNEKYFSKTLETKEFNEYVEEVHNELETEQITAIVPVKAENKILAWLKKLFRIGS